MVEAFGEEGEEEEEEEAETEQTPCLKFEDKEGNIGFLLRLHSACEAQKIENGDLPRSIFRVVIVMVEFTRLEGPVSRRVAPISASKEAASDRFDE